MAVSFYGSVLLPFIESESLMYMTILSVGVAVPLHESYR